MPRHAIRELRLIERPRERLVAIGAPALSAPELLSVLWGTAAVAEQAIARHGSLSDLARADVLELTALPGVGSARAAQLVAAFEIGRRSTLAGDGADRRWKVRAPRDVTDRLLPEMALLEREELRVLLLNTKNVVLRSTTVYVGNVSAAVVRIGELFRDAVRTHAAGVVLVHNHPSGDPEPSADDLHLTAEAIAAGRLLDIAVLDHIIVAAEGYISLRDRGVAFDRR